MKKHPKALNLELLEVIEKPVTLGFKVNPDVKLNLAKKAAESGLSLSMYVKNVLTQKQKIEKIELNEIYHINQKLREKIRLYENSTLKNLYERHKGNNVKFKDNQGNYREVIIKDIIDVHNIIINSFESI